MTVQAPRAYCECLNRGEICGQSKIDCTINFRISICICEDLLDQINRDWEQARCHRVFLDVFPGTQIGIETHELSLDLVRGLKDRHPDLHVWWLRPGDRATTCRRGGISLCWPTSKEGYLVRTCLLL